MEREIRESKIDSKIQFRGWLESAAVADEMSQADLLLLTSHSEGLPMAAIESLDKGLTIISSRIGGVSDVVEVGVNGLLCDTTPESFAEALREVLCNPERLYGMRQASSDRAARFDLAPSIDRYEQILGGTARRLDEK